MRGLYRMHAGAAGGVVVYGCASRLTAAKTADAKAADPVRKPTGIEKREAWTKSKVVGSAEPPDPYTVVKVYPKLTFFEALELIPVPGQKTWLVAERPGK